MSEIILYDAANVPSPRRVRMCLIEKGLPFTIRWLNLGLMDQKRPDYLKLNPTGLVPSLLHDGKVLYESNVINEYLDAIHPVPPLVPKEPYAQAEMRMWFAFETDWGKPFRDAVYETMGKERLKSSGLTPDQLGAEIAKRTANASYARFATQVMSTPRNDQLIADRLDVLMEKIGTMNDRLADGRQWLVGDQFTLADMALAPRLDMFPVIGVNDISDRFPRVGGFLARVKERPSWGASVIRPEHGETERFVDPRKLAEQPA